MVKFEVAQNILDVLMKYKILEIRKCRNIAAIWWPMKIVVT